MKVICTLPNASASINGVAFEDHADGKVSVDDLSADAADRFLAIPGFVIADEAPPPKAKGGKNSEPS